MSERVRDRVSEGERVCVEREMKSKEGRTLATAMPKQETASAQSTWWDLTALQNTAWHSVWKRNKRPADWTSTIISHPLSLSIQYYRAETAPGPHGLLHQVTILIEAIPTHWPPVTPDVIGIISVKSGNAINRFWYGSSAVVASSHSFAFTIYIHPTPSIATRYYLSIVHTTRTKSPTKSTPGSQPLFRGVLLAFTRDD